MKILCDLNFQTINQGAQTSIYLAVSEDVSKISGKYFKDCKVTNVCLLNIIYIAVYVLYT